MKKTHLYYFLWRCKIYKKMKTTIIQYYKYGGLKWLTTMSLSLLKNQVRLKFLVPQCWKYIMKSVDKTIFKIQRLMRVSVQPSELGRILFNLFALEMQFLLYYQLLSFQNTKIYINQNHFVTIPVCSLH